MRDEIKEMIQTLEKEKIRLEAIRDEKIQVHLQTGELLNENWTSNTMEMIFYHIEIEKYSAKIAVLNELLNEKK
jgi:hypothetical protein